MLKINYDLCYGCSACASICPQKSIEMVCNEKGFLYPQINTLTCISCKLCEKICPIGKNELLNPIKAVYAVKDNNLESRMKSSSGAAFSLVSDLFLNNNAMIYGAVFNDDMIVTHIGTSDQSIRDRMRGSKYVQSIMGETINNIKRDLKSGKKVLFTGTPCQVAGIKSVIKDENLFTCDIICHGVSSPLIFSEYIKGLEKKYGKIKTLTFRNKKVSWRGCNIQLITEKGTYLNTLKINSYKHIYYGHYAMRQSCFNCEYSCEKRVSDLTLGDFWGIENINPDFDDGCGVSIVLVNTSKGEVLFEKIKDKSMWFVSELSQTNQPQLHKHIERKSINDTFWNDYFRKGYSFIEKTYGECGVIAQLKNIVRKILK